MHAEWFSGLSNVQRDWIASYFEHRPPTFSGGSIIAAIEFSDFPTTISFDETQQAEFKQYFTYTSEFPANRMIMFVHKDNQGPDRDLLEQLARTCKIDPLFLLTYLFWDYRNYTTPFTRKLQSQPVPLLPSEDFLILSYNGSHLGAISLEMSPTTGSFPQQYLANATVVVLSSTRPWQKGEEESAKGHHPLLDGDLITNLTSCHFGGEYCKVLNRLRVPKHHPGASSAEMYILPLAEMIAECYSIDLRRLRQFNHKSFPSLQSSWVIRRLGDDKDGWRNITRLHTHFSRTKEALKTYTVRYKEKRPVANILGYYDNLEDQFKEIRANLMFLAAEEAALNGVFEMRIANDTANSVRMLTILGFIFVPAGLLISFFGMNLKFVGGQLDVGPTKFFSYCVGIWAGVMILAAIVYLCWHMFSNNYQRSKTKRKATVMKYLKDLEFGL